MGLKHRIRKSCILALSLALVLTMNTPRVAWGTSEIGVVPAEAEGELSGAYDAVSDPAASILKSNGSTKTYDTLVRALSAVSNGDTVTLLRDEVVEQGKGCSVNNRSFTLDLNGFSVSGTGFYTLYVSKYVEGSVDEPADVLIKNGSIENAYDEGSYPSIALYVNQSINLTLENVNLSAAPLKEGIPGYGLRIGNSTTNERHNPSVTVKGEGANIWGSDAGISVISSPERGVSRLVLEGGIVAGGNFGIAGNGACDGTSIEVKGGTVSAKGEGGCALYHPQDGDVALSGGTFTGANGVQYSGKGTLNITGGSFKATAPEVVPDADTESASILDGAAVSVVSRGGGYGSAGSAEVSITGGTFVSDNNVAIREYGASGLGSLVSTFSISPDEGAALCVVGGAGKPAVSLAALVGDGAKVISGGTFSSEVNDYCVDGFAAFENAEGTFDVLDVHVAAIGQAKYLTFSDALKAAKDGDTVTLLRDTSVDVTATVGADLQVTLDLNGQVLSGKPSPLLSVEGALTVKDSSAAQTGTIEGTTKNGIVIQVKSGSLEMTSGTVTGGYCIYATSGKDKSAQVALSGGEVIGTIDGVFAQGNISASDRTAHVVEVEVSGSASVSALVGGPAIQLQGSGAKLAMSGGEVSGGPGYGALSGNGTVNDTANYGGTEIVITGGTVTGVTDYGADGKVAYSGNALYHPQSGTVVVSGGTLTADTAIEMRAGTLNVEGGSIIGTLTPANVKPNGSGSTTDGAGISVAQHRTKLPLNVHISGGTISGFSALYESNPEGNPAESIANVSLSVTGGSLNAINGGKMAVYSENKQAFITGGAFNTALDAAYYDGSIYTQNALDAPEAAGALVPKTFTLSYELNGGTLPEGVDNPDTYTYFDRDIALANPVKPGYTFVGWTSTDLADASIQVVIPAQSKGNRTYTATWSPKTDGSYTVHYYREGTTQKLAEDKVVQGCTFGQSYREEAPEIEGYAVRGVGWQEVSVNAYGTEASFFYVGNEARITFDTNGGTPVSEIVGKTGEMVGSSLSVSTRSGYGFAGWYADAALTVLVRELPETFPAGTTVYYAKWNAVPLPDSAIEIQVEVPQLVEGGTYAAVPESAVEAAAGHAERVLAAIMSGEVPAGVSPESAQEVADLVRDAKSEDVKVVVSLGFSEKSDVGEDEKGLIDDVSTEGEEAALYLSLTVTMTVHVEGVGVAEVSLGQVEEPLLFEVHVDPALIKGKSVRIAHVHNGITEVLYPESVDRERGIVRFYAQKFSTYALLTSDSVTVAFESNGGSAVEAQTVKFGAKAVKPADPTREGFTFAGWFMDESLTVTYDFTTPVERSLMLYAQWTAVGGGAPGGQSPDVSVSQAKPLPQADSLVSTGDESAPLVAGVVVVAAVAGATVGISVLRRRKER